MPRHVWTNTQVKAAADAFATAPLSVPGTLEKTEYLESSKQIWEAIQGASGDREGRCVDGDERMEDCEMEAGSGSQGGDEADHDTVGSQKVTEASTGQSSGMPWKLVDVHSVHDPNSSVTGVSGVERPNHRGVRGGAEEQKKQQKKSLAAARAAESNGSTNPISPSSSSKAAASLPSSDTSAPQATPTSTPSYTTHATPDLDGEVKSYAAQLHELASIKNETERLREAIDLLFRDRRTVGENDAPGTGENEGPTVGETEGRTAGENEGPTAGENEGRIAGENEGHTAGEEEDAEAADPPRKKTRRRHKKRSKRAAEAQALLEAESAAASSPPKIDGQNAETLKAQTPWENEEGEPSTQAPRGNGEDDASTQAPPKIEEGDCVSRPAPHQSDARLIDVTPDLSSTEKVEAETPIKNPYEETWQSRRHNYRRKLADMKRNPLEAETGRRITTPSLLDTLGARPADAAAAKADGGFTTRDDGDEKVKAAIAASKKTMSRLSKLFDTEKPSKGSNIRLIMTTKPVAPWMAEANALIARLPHSFTEAQEMNVRAAQKLRQQSGLHGKESLDTNQRTSRSHRSGT
ncbi:MAG: hypothetical protein Q9183_006328, partial [Haloplaca sp. 2 TL-2023]